MHALTFGKDKLHPYRRGYPPVADAFLTKGELKLAKNQYKEETKNLKKISDDTGNFLYRGWDPAQLSNSGSGPILRSETKFSRDARENTRWNVENLGKVIELTDPTSGEKKRVPLEEITEETFKGDQLTVCDMMGQCAMYVLTAAGAALIAAKLAGVLGGKKSRRNKSKRNKSKRNKSKRNKSKRNKSKKNKRNRMRSIRRR